MKIASWELQKFELDRDKVLNHIYIIMLYVHYNIVACRRTFEHDVTKCGQLQAPRYANVCIWSILIRDAPRFSGLFNRASKRRAPASENPTLDTSNFQHLQGDPRRPLGKNILNVCGATRSLHRDQDQILSMLIYLQ